MDLLYARTQVRTWKKKCQYRQGKRKQIRKQNLGKKPSPLIMMSWSDRSQGQRYPYINFFSANNSYFPKWQKRIRFWERARSITVWFSQTVVHKIDKTALCLMNYRQIFSHFGRIKSNFFSEGNSTDFHLIIISRSLFFLWFNFWTFHITYWFSFPFFEFLPLANCHNNNFQTSLFFYPWPLKRSVPEPEQMSSI